jgi:hypothetical protein
VRLCVDELERQEEERDDVEDEPDRVVDSIGAAGTILRLEEPSEETPPGDKGRDDEDAARKLCEQRDGRPLTDSVVLQLAVGLVVPVQVVDPEGDAREDEDTPGTADLGRGGRVRNRDPVLGAACLGLHP